MSDSGSNPESRGQLATRTNAQRRDSKSQSLFHAAIGGYSKGPSIIPYGTPEVAKNR